jgi:hypothetical protein
MQRSFAAIAGLTCLAWGGAAFAQAPSQADVEKAEQRYLEAVDAFKAGDARHAAELFHESWELAPKPELLYNEAFAWARSGDVKRAREVALDAARSDLPDSMRVKNLARLHAWSTRLQGEATSEQIARAVEQAASSPPAVADSRTSTAAQPDTETGVSESVSPSVERHSTGRVIGVVLGATGLVGLGVAGYSSWTVRQIGDQLDEHSRDDDLAAYRSDLARGERFQTIGLVSLVSGAALVGTGLVVWLASGRSERSDAQAIRFTFDGSAVHATLRF